MPIKKHLCILYFFWYVFVFCAMDKSGTKDYNRVYETVSVPRETMVILKTAQQNLGPADTSPGTLYRPDYYLLNLKTSMMFHHINMH